MNSISKLRGTKSIGASIASLPPDEARALIEGLSPNAQAALPYLFDLWGMSRHQLPPEGDWKTWLILGGRGAGKTRAGAEWVRAEVEGRTPLAPGRRRRIALVGATLDEARDVMAMGESGVLACSPPDRRPRWSQQRRTLTWPNGAEATCFSAASPEKLRGPQFDGAWADELGKWTKAEEAWDMLQFALRLGDDPRQVVTTTPRANPVLEMLIDDAATVTVSAPTRENRANLARSFLAEVERRYAGGARAREELEGEMVLDRAGALWTREMIERSRVPAAPPLGRIVVALDPPAGMGPKADECGLIVAGLGPEGRAYVLADRSSQGEAPEGWARRVAAAFEEFGADRVIAEANQGGRMVESVLRAAAPHLPVRLVHAREAKAARAEPVSALYEQGKVRHVGLLPGLEDQMRGFGFAEGRSPDRVDALVWALWALLLAPEGQPRARRI